jgi:phospholipase C
VTKQAGTRTGRMRPASRAWLAVFSLAGCLLAVGCGATSGATTAASLATTPSTGPASSGPHSAPTASVAGTSSAATPGDLRKILVIMEENHSVQQS